MTCITFDAAKKLRHGQILYHTILTNADGSPQKWRVNGKVKTWKKEPDRIEVPLKRGLKEYAILSERDLKLVSLKEE